LAFYLIGGWDAAAESFNNDKTERDRLGVPSPLLLLLLLLLAHWLEKEAVCKAVIMSSGSQTPRRPG
jgi:hypothetical protein